SWGPSGRSASRAPPGIPHRVAPGRRPGATHIGPAPPAVPQIEITTSQEGDMTKPSDDDRTPGRGRTRWGRQTEPPTTPPDDERPEEQEPAPGKATPRTAQTSSGTPAPPPNETPEAPAHEG